MKKHFRKFVAQNVIDESFKDCNMWRYTCKHSAFSLLVSLSLFQSLLSYLCINIAYSRLSIDYPLFQLCS